MSMDVSDGISLVLLLVFVVLCIMVYCWSLWSFAWWLEEQQLRGQHFRIAS
jgi:sensor domain CHASE-containing protein